MRSNFHKIGIIGKGSQYLRISKILKKKKYKFFVYKPNKSKGYFDKKDFSVLAKCSVIFILSPNKTHLNYIKKLKNKYIFCEKPPVSTKNDLRKLLKMNYKKMYFNYNFRFSKIAEILKNRNQYKLGDLLYANIISGHGLGFKKEYQKSWRANIKLCKKGVHEIVSIHWIDLINYIFDVKKINIPTLSNVLKNGTSYDNSFSKLILKNKCEVDIFSSYSSPFINNFSFVFTNGLITCNEKLIEIRGPALNFDKKNFFKKPKLIKKIKIVSENDYIKSLEKSVNYFLGTVKKKKNFKKSEFIGSLNSNELII